MNAVPLGPPHAAPRPRLVWRLRLALMLIGLAALLALLIALAALAIPAPALAAGASDLIERGHWKEARALLEPEVQAHPGDAAAICELSQVRMAYRDVDGALRLAEKAVALEPKNARAHEQLAMVLGEKASHAGALHQIGLARRFKREADAAVALDPGRLDAQWGLMLFYWKAPGIVGGDKNKARAQADRIAVVDAAKGELARARLAIEGHDTTAALAHWRKAVELGPQDYEARVTLASQLAARNDWEGAEQQALEAKRIDSGRSSAYALLAAADAHAGRWNDLDPLLDAARGAVPGNLSAYYQAARTLIVDGREFPRAERYLRAYLGGEPENGSPPLAAAHWRLAQALEKQGRKAEAIAELETALKARPDFEDAKKDLKRLKKQA